jgi:hypothetical protein
MPKREKPFHLDMPFDEALKRYAQADPREAEEQEKKVTKRRKRANQRKIGSDMVISPRMDDP